MFCSRCGAALSAAPGFCARCGQPLPAPAPPARKSRVGLGCLLALVAFLALCALIALPGYLATRRRAENMAADMVRTLHKAELLYAERYPAVGFTCDLQKLSVPPTLIVDGPSGARYVRYGYRFEVRHCAAEKPGGPVTQYQIVARPLDRRRRVLCSDQTRTLRAGADEAAACLPTGWPLP